MRRVVFSPLAKADLRETVDYVARQSGSADVADRLRRALKRACERLAAMSSIVGRARPELGDGIRSFVAGRYVIYFCYAEETILIVRVLHGARDLAAQFPTSPEAD